MSNALQPQIFTFGITRQWPLDKGEMSMNAKDLAVSISLKLGMSPLMILQKIQPALMMNRSTGKKVSFGRMDDCSIYVRLQTLMLSLFDWQLRSYWRISSVKA